MEGEVDRDVLGHPRHSNKRKLSTLLVHFVVLQLVAAKFFSSQNMQGVAAVVVLGAVVQNRRTTSQSVPTIAVCLCFAT